MEAEQNLFIVRNKRLIISIQNKLDSWFEKNSRSFPWRVTNNPYNVLIAEKLLQKTAAREHVVNIYNEFISNYNSPVQLATANLEGLKQLLFPLGLFGRAEELIILAEQIVKDHNCQIPNNIKSLMQLEGVGEYIARAVLCFGFDKDIAIVDTNVARWLYRINNIPSPITKNPSRNKILLSEAQKLVPDGNAKRYNWAVLDLCASICLPRTPKCLICPMMKYCEFGKNILPK